MLYASTQYELYTALHLEGKESRLNNLIFVLSAMKPYLKIWQFKYSVIKINYELTCQIVTSSKQNSIQRLAREINLMYTSCLALLVMS